MEPAETSYLLLKFLENLVRYRLAKTICAHLQSFISSLQFCNFAKRINADLLTKLRKKLLRNT